MGVQIRVAGPAVAMGERGCQQTLDVDLPDAVGADPGEQGVLLEIPKPVRYCRMVCLLDLGGDRWVGERPQSWIPTSPVKRSRSYPATAVVAGRDSRANAPDNSRASSGDSGRAGGGRTPAPPQSGSAPAHRPAAVPLPVGRQPG